MKKILLVEDDRSLGYVLQEYLALHSMEVKWVTDGLLALQALEKEAFDLCLLDVMMPELDGFSLAAQIRKNYSSLPFIFLTAKTLKIDKLKAFTLGADDYITKPVDEEELVARIRAVLRRTAVAVAQDNRIFQVGQFHFDYTAQTISGPGGPVMVISAREAELLWLLCQNKGRLLPRREALLKIWGTNDYFNRRSMDVFISKLRGYFLNDPSVRIRNIHGKGFILEEIT